MSKELAVYLASQEVLAIAVNADIHVETGKIYFVTDSETYTAVDEYIADVVADLKKIEALKELAIRGYKDAYDERNTFFNAIINKLKGAKRDLLQKQSVFNKRQEDVARAAQAEANKAARDLAAQGVQVDAPVITAATPKGRTKYRDKWVAEVTSMNLLLKHVMENPDLIDWLVPNESTLRTLAGQVKKEGNFAPGLKIVNKRIPIS